MDIHKLAKIGTIFRVLLVSTTIMWFGCAMEIEEEVTPAFEIVLERIEEGDVAFKGGDYSEALDLYRDAKGDLKQLLEIQEDRYVEGQYRLTLSTVQRKIQLAQIGREIFLVRRAINR